MLTTYNSSKQFTTLVVWLFHDFQQNWFQNSDASLSLKVRNGQFPSPFIIIQATALQANMASCRRFLDYTTKLPMPSMPTITQHYATYKLEKLLDIIYKNKEHFRNYCIIPNKYILAVILGITRFLEVLPKCSTLNNYWNI